MEYFLRNIDDGLWKEVRIKALRNDLTAGEAIRRLLKAWVDGKVEIPPESKPRKKS